jgi:hypothetical protein
MKLREMPPMTIVGAILIVGVLAIVAAVALEYIGLGVLLYVMMAMPILLLVGFAVVLISADRPRA